MNENEMSRNSNNEESENIQLPLIDSKLIPFQKDNDITKNEDEKINKLNLIDSKTVLISRKTETEKFDMDKPKDIIKDEAISDLLKEKIVINNNKYSYRNIFLTKLKNDIPKKKRLNRYINENILLNSPIKIHNNKVKLKHVKINNILTEVDKNDYEQNKNEDFDRRLYNLRLYNYLKEERKAKIMKPPEKKLLKKSGLEIAQSNWRKNITCSLDYKYTINKNDINSLNLRLKLMNKNSKLFFDIFKSESNEMLEQVWNT